MAKRKKARFHYTDRSVLNRDQFELAMKNEQRCVNWGFITKYLMDRMRKYLIDNIHVEALKENLFIDSTVGDIAYLYTKSVISGNTDLEQ